MPIPESAFRNHPELRALIRDPEKSFFRNFDVEAVDRRMAEHDAGTGAKYTKGRGPFQLLYQEACQGRGPASKRESEIKSLDRKAKLSLVSPDGPA